MPCLLGLATTALLTGRPAGAAPPVVPDKAFVDAHCTSCHNAEDKTGRLDLTTLAFDPTDPANLTVWVRVHDRVAVGEMLAVLPEREQRIVYLRFFEGLTQSEIAEQIGISQMHVSRLLVRSLETLGEHLVLPPKFEPLRARLEQILTPLPNPRERVARLPAQ